MQCPPAQVNLSSYMQQQQQVAQMAVAFFYQQIMAGQQKNTPMHIAALNNLGQNNFANAAWNQWVQMTVDYTECLMRSTQQPMPAQQAAAHAAQAVYQGYLGQLYMSNQMMFQGQLPPQMIQELITAANNVGQVQQQIQIMRQQTQVQQPQYYTGAPRPAPANYSQYGVGAQPLAINGGGYAGGGSNTSGNEISQSYDIPGADQPLVPKQEWSSDGHQTGAYSVNPTQPAQQDTTVSVQEQISDTTLPIPKDISEVKVDPFYYTPRGFKTNPERPYDVIYNPGGIEIRPAHTVNWKRTPGDDAVYSTLADPKQYCYFLVKFPDGSVKETFAKWIPMMDYMRHEIDDELRRRAYRPSGVVKAVTSDFADMTEPTRAAETLAAAAEKLNTLRKGQAANPIIIEEVFAGESDTDNEIEARQAIQAAAPEAEAIPAHEYRTLKRHRLDIDDSLGNKLQAIAEHTSYGMIQGDLKALVLAGELPIRVFRQLDARLTKDVNAFLKDSLGVKQWMESFCEDIVDMVDLVGNQYGAEIRDKFIAATKVVGGRALNVVTLKEAESEEIYWFLEDRYVNFQMPWVLADVSTQNIQQEPVLLSAQSSPVLQELILGMWKRAQDGGHLPIHRLRLITLDGQYIDIIRGHLVTNAVLLKLNK